MSNIYTKSILLSSIFILNNIIEKQGFAINYIFSSLILSFMFVNILIIVDHKRFIERYNNNKFYSYIFSRYYFLMFIRFLIFNTNKLIFFETLYIIFSIIISYNIIYILFEDIVELMIKIVIFVKISLIFSGPILHLAIKLF